jgi:uncharacterized protein YukE
MALPFVVFFKAQALVDWWQLRGYTPPPAVSSLATQDTMTAYAQHVFYVNHPNIESNANQFRSDCQESEKTVVLGCYHGNQDGIFIYNVNDSRLSGVQQVTAAHEMLHGAYDRLSTKDRNQVNSMLEDFYNNDLHDQRVIDTINAYKQTEPNDVVNEMHSVFGTEVGSLTPQLENYYTHYFSSRQTIVSFTNSYEGEFTIRTDEIKADDAQLAQLKIQINQTEANLQAELSHINSDRRQLDSLRTSGQTQAYNSRVDSFNIEVGQYNTGVENLKNQIAAYNQLVAARNAIANELSSLSQALDTRLAPQTAQ